MHSASAAGDSPIRPIEVTAGVDWFRTILGQQKDTDSAEKWARQIQAADEDRGGEVQPWSFMGFEGYRTERLRWGRRDWRLLLETSGGCGHDMWRHLASFGGRVTRVDLQVTALFSEPLPSFGTRSLRRAESTPRPRHLPATLIGRAKRTDGLFIGTVGKRTSEQYLRVYDKGVEERTHAPGRRWRIELEAKGTTAIAVGRELCEAPSEPELCSARVASSWRYAGCSWLLPDGSV